MDNLLKSLGVGLSTALRYTVGGIVFVVLLFIIDPVSESQIKAALHWDLGWELMVIYTVAIGTVVYALHRHFVIPIHGLLGCTLLNLSECFGNIGSPKWGKRKQNSLNPTRWLAHKGVPVFRRMIAYGALRHLVYKDGEGEAIDVLHAEGGLIVMLSEAFFVVGCFLPSASTFTDKPMLFKISAALFFLSAISGMQQHRVECNRFKGKENEPEIIKLIDNFKKV